MICDHEWPQRFQLAYYDVYCIPALEHTAIAEIVTTMIAQAYAQNGCGFNCFPAGISISSAASLTNDEWDDCLAFSDESCMRQEALDAVAKKSQRLLAVGEKQNQDLETNLVTLAILRTLNDQTSQDIP